MEHHQTESVTIRASRALAKLLTEMDAGRMTLGEAEVTAQLAFEMDGDEVDYVVRRMREWNEGTDAPEGG